MIGSLLLALAFAKLRKYKLRPLLKAYSLYPFYVLTLMMALLQMSIFLRDYTLIKYAPYIKSVYLASLILPFLQYKLFKPGLIGAGFILAGTLLNKFVMLQNGGKMPVYPTLSKLTGYYTDSALSTVDSIHVAGTAATKFKFLTDYIDIGFSILSIGDVLIHSFVFIILYYSIKELNLRMSGGKQQS